MNYKQQVWRIQEVGRETWDKYWIQVQFSNLMQCWEYGEAKHCQGWKAIRFLVFDGNDKPFGLLQVLFKGLPILGGIARINRGPVLFNDPLNTPLDIEQVYMLWSSIYRVAKVRRWWYISIAPELPDDNNYLSVLHNIGFNKKEKRIAWGSARLLLKPDTDVLLMGLKPKWRNMLRKGYKLEAKIEEVTNDESILLLMEHYVDFQKEKGFVGIPSALLKKIYFQSGTSFRFKVYQATGVGGKDVSGFVFIIHHGDTATYLVGWSSEEGRQLQANYLLLWKGIEEAKTIGLRWFDMGGLNQNTTKGVARFKEGINGLPYQLIGEF